jgi:hypothetical protein
MTLALELLIFACIFALAIGLLGSFMSSSDRHKEKLRAEHESRRHAQQPWDARSSRGRGNR